MIGRLFITQCEEKSFQRILRRLETFKEAEEKMKRIREEKRIKWKVKGRKKR